MNGYEIFGRIVLSLTGLYIIFKTLGNIGQRLVYSHINWFGWIVAIALIILGGFLAYKPLEEILFRKKS